MSAYAHGVLTTDHANNSHQWKVFARDEVLAAERAEGELGPHPVNYEHQIAMLGSRGWRMVQVLQHGDDLQFWFHRELQSIVMPPHDTVG